LRADTLLALEEESIQAKPRFLPKMLPARERILDFREVEVGLDERQAHEEARRCLRCDLERK
jgi:NADH-quinone oxidoreductase subunit F